MITRYFLLFLISTSLEYSEAGGFGFTIHRRRDSPLSSSYNHPNASAADRWNAIYQRSMSRYNYLRSKFLNSASPDNLRVPVVPGTIGIYEYEMTFAMGTPPVDITANVDTGSGLSWIQCLPCRACYTQNAPIFDPSQSLSFHNLPCACPACNVDIPKKTCGSGFCQYYAVYDDRSQSKGDVAMVDFIVPTTEGDNYTIPAVVFGCGLANMGIFDKMEQGVIGLDMSSASLIIQLGTHTDFKFSYSFVPYYEDGGSQMLFGDRAVMAGNSMPLAVNSNDTFYYVDLDDISVGSERLNLPPGLFRRRLGHWGMIIDTGTPLTHLLDYAFKKLVWKLKETVNLPPMQDPDSIYLFFNGTGSDLVGEKVPSVTFHFAGGVDLVWAPMYSFFVASPEKVCLAVVSLERATVSVLGGLAQQNINVGIDVGSSRVYMSAQDCLSFGSPP